MTQNRAFDMLAIGDPTFDIVFAVHHIPGVDDKTLGRRIGTFSGGTAANAACAAACMGARAASFGRIGDDPEGDAMARDFARFGVSTDYLAIEKETPSAVAMIMIDPGGEKSLVYAPMPIAPWDRQRLGSALAESRVAYSMPYDLDNFRLIASLARENGANVAIDIEPSMLGAPDRFETLLALSDIVFLNEAGFTAGTGLPARPDAARTLLDLGPQVVVVTRGPRGAIGVTRDRQAATSAYSSNVVDTTGAGDCFNGSFLAAHLGGAGIEEALGLAAAAASFAIGAVGARSGFAGKAAIMSRYFEAKATPC